MTPACAGTTPCGHSSPPTPADDPRVCGDDILLDEVLAAAAG